MDHTAGEAQRETDVLALIWAVGALASVILAVAHLPFVVVALINGTSWSYAYPAVLLVQGGLCVAGAVGLLRQRPAFAASAAVLLAVVQAGIAGITWPNYSPYLWLLWIGPAPVLIPALAQLAAATVRGRHSQSS
jgi:hypothetical protein